MEMTTVDRKITMTCPACDIRCASFGKHRNGLRRFRCGQCGKTYTEQHESILGNMTIPEEKALLALRMLLEGSSIRSVERTTELHRDTIMRLLTLAGERAEKVMGGLIVNVPVRDVECDEIWSFIGKKEKRVRPEDDQNLGDCYTFVAIERHTKLVLNVAIGKRDQTTTDVFIEGLRHATAARVPYHITTDGFAPYRSAITTTLPDRISGYAQLIKVYRATPEGERKYSPAEVISTEVVRVFGESVPERVCTSIIERSNLSMRMGVRRFTRLTNAFSKKWENHAAAIMLWFAYYNFCRVHKSLRVTPAMESGIADHVWSVRELLS